MSLVIDDDHTDDHSDSRGEDSGRAWVAIGMPAGEGSEPEIKSSEPVQVDIYEGLDRPEITRARRAFQVTYEVPGGWKSEYQFGDVRYDLFSVPGAILSGEEGRPQVPQDGLYVPLPEGSEQVEVRLVNSAFEDLNGKWVLRPGPAHLIEEEYLAGSTMFQEDSEIYDADDYYPAELFRNLGVKVLDGLLVLHLIVYLAQWKPRSARLRAVKSLELQVSYDVADSGLKSFESGWSRPALGPLSSSLVLGGQPGFHSFEAGFEAFEGDVSPPEVDETSDLKSSDYHSNYLIITPNALQSAVAPLKEARKDLNAQIVTIEQIRKNFEERTRRKSIRAFLNHVWNNWQRDRSQALYVVLAADHDEIPVQHFTSVLDDGGKRYASDHYYSDFGRGEDEKVHILAPELIVSRIPTSDADQMQAICEHLANYSTLRAAGEAGWGQRVLLVAYNDKAYLSCSDGIAQQIENTYVVKKLYGGRSSQQHVIDGLNDGALIVNYRGHGSQTDWSSKNGLSTKEIPDLHTENKPPFVFCICCQNGWIDDESVESVSEALLRKHKAVAVIASSRDSYTEPNNWFNLSLFQAILKPEVHTVGEAYRLAEENLLQKSGGMDVMPFTELNVRIYMLFGDPAAAF